MGYLIGFMGLGCLALGIFGFALRNGALEVASIVMLLVCITLCVLDALVAVNGGAGKEQVFNWLAAFHAVRRPEEDDSYYDV